MSARRATRREVDTGDYIITTCPCCGSWPIRSTWLRTCPTCGQQRCLTNYPEAAAACRSCQGLALIRPAGMEED